MSLSIEFTRSLYDNKNLKCVSLKFGLLDYDDEARYDTIITVLLKVGYNSEEYNKFLKQIELIDLLEEPFYLTVDSILWYEDGCWAEYDEDCEMPGIYFWRFHDNTPEIPEELK